MTEVEVEAAAEAAAEAHSPRTERPVTAHADEEEKACPGAGGSTSSTGSSRTGLVYDERFLLHVPDYQHPEAPVRAARIFDKLREYGTVPLRSRYRMADGWWLMCWCAVRCTGGGPWWRLRHVNWSGTGTGTVC